MNETKECLKRLFIMYFLVSLAIPMNARLVPKVFPISGISSLYLAGLCIGLIYSYHRRITFRGSLSRYVIATPWMMLLLILTRGLKYSVVGGVDGAARFFWYFYYVPMLILPLLETFAAVHMQKKDDWKMPRAWHILTLLTVIFIALILTNDYHQMAFSFQEGFQNWDSDYSRGWLWFAAIVFQLGLYLLSFLILLRKCRVQWIRKHMWILLLPFLSGMVLVGMVTFDCMFKIAGMNILEFPECYCILVASTMESCIVLGLIPTNEKHVKLFRSTSVPVQITDNNGVQIYRSESAADLTPEQFDLPDGSRMDPHTVLHKIRIPGGFGFWQDDVTQLDKLNSALEESKEGLSEEVQLIHLQNDLKEKSAKIRQRTAVYNAIDRQIYSQSDLISQLADAGLCAETVQEKERLRRRIVLVSSYIKRYANLMLLAEDQKVLPAGELGLSLFEILRYLRYYGIPCDLLYPAEGSAAADSMLAALQVFEALLEADLQELRGLFINLSDTEEGIAMRLTLEGVESILSEASQTVLREASVSWELTHEDDNTYICFVLKKGGLLE